MLVRILLTAFGAFPGAPVNPTAALARRVAVRERRRLARLGIEIVTAELPVIYAGAESRAQELVERHRPDAVLHLGLAGRRKALTLEARARNRLSVLHPDARRARSGRLLVEAGAPDALPARAPIARTVAAMAGAGPACRRSIDAGDYLCNLTLWATLRSPAPVAAFLHIPKPGPRVTLPRMADGVTAAILTLAREARLQRTA